MLSKGHEEIKKNKEEDSGYRANSVVSFHLHGGFTSSNFRFWRSFRVRGGFIFRVRSFRQFFLVFKPKFGHLSPKDFHILEILF